MCAGYTNIPNDVLYNTQLSPEGRLLYVFIKSKQNMANWCWRRDWLKNMSGYGRDKVDKALKELELKGFITKKLVRQGGRYNHLKITVNDIPVTENQLTVNSMAINKDKKIINNNKRKMEEILKNVEKSLKMYNKV